MSNTFEPRGSDFLDEDLYFIFDDENFVYETYNKVAGIYISSDIEWPCLDSDEESDEEEMTGSKIKKNKKSYRLNNNSKDGLYPEITPSAFKVLCGYMDNLENDAEFRPHLQNYRNAEIKEVPLISSKHKDYRRFRYYDLIRSKLRLDHSLNSDEEEKEGHEKVQFNMEIGILEFESDEIIQHDSPEIKEPLVLSSILSEKRNSDVIPPHIFFSLIENTYALELEDLLQETYERCTWEIPIDYHRLQGVIWHAKKQAVSATENILRAFESVSILGKYSIGVINRIQALAMRFLVLNDPENLTQEKHLQECLVDCQELQQDILVFKNLVSESEEIMTSKSCHISAGSDGSICGSEKVKELFSMIYERDHASWRYLQAIIGSNDTYTRCINFLTEMKPERVFRFLETDFSKMHHDMGNIDYLCCLLLDSIGKSIEEINDAVA